MASTANSMAEVTRTRRPWPAELAPITRLRVISCSLLFSRPARARGGDPADSGSAVRKGHAGPGLGCYAAPAADARDAARGDLFLPGRGSLPGWVSVGEVRTVTARRLTRRRHCPARLGSLDVERVAVSVHRVRRL